MSRKAWVPIMVSAPGRFSTTTGWFQRLASPSASVRAATSTEIPGANGVMIRTVRSGQSPDDADWGMLAKPASTTPAARRCGQPRFLIAASLGLSWTVCGRRRGAMRRGSATISLAHVKYEHDAYRRPRSDPDQVACRAVALAQRFARRATDRRVPIGG